LIPQRFVATGAAAGISADLPLPPAARAPDALNMNIRLLLLEELFHNCPQDQKHKESDSGKNQEFLQCIVAENNCIQIHHYPPAYYIFKITSVLTELKLELELELELELALELELELALELELELALELALELELELELALALELELELD